MQAPLIYLNTKLNKIKAIENKGINSVLSKFADRDYAPEMTILYPRDVPNPTVKNAQKNLHLLFSTWWLSDYF
jgi:lactam utilization protein B